MSSLQTVALMLAILGFSASFASAAPRMVKQFDHWGLFSYKDGGKTVCYVLSVPSKEDPVGIDHGKNFFLIAPKKTGGVNYYPQAVMGYNVAQGSTIDVNVDDKTFQMVPKANVGWTRLEAEDVKVIAAMKQGRRMTVKTTSKRGTQTTYTYSLQGVSAALKQAQACR
ncbi:invasion associated locus B family protein [Agrobacterium vitis]